MSWTMPPPSGPGPCVICRRPDAPRAGDLCPRCHVVVYGVPRAAVTA